MYVLSCPPFKGARPHPHCAPVAVARVPSATASPWQRAQRIPSALRPTALLSCSPHSPALLLLTVPTLDPALPFPSCSQFVSHSVVTMKAMKENPRVLAEAGAVGAEPCQRSSAEPKGCLHRIHRSMPHPKMKTIRKNRSLQLQTLGRQHWWVLVAKELLLGMCPQLSPGGCANLRWRLGRSVEMWMQLEMAMDIDVPEDEEMEVDGEEEEAMDVDPPSGGQALVSPEEQELLRFKLGPKGEAPPWFQERPKN
ncbi:uncharacterized protein LOC128911086 [Rissa tridactyla]|uniref:uncharacterized protein LOC128911086 n=1 Tax=Rissa tridactyla TaxID=75485 RepID=UPI0023BB047F|nr:uncharacterized protein LOC128911086 [Rissa tridactyla]